MKSIALSLCGLLGLFGSAPVLAGVEPFTCPPLLPATLRQAKEAPAGFVATQEPAKHVLDAFRINEGPLERRAGAIYDDVKTQTDAKGTVTERLVWSVPKTPGALAICGYSFTSVVLTRSLEGYSTCTAVSRKQKGGAFELQSAECH